MVVSKHFGRKKWHLNHAKTGAPELSTLFLLRTLWFDLSTGFERERN